MRFVWSAFADRRAGPSALIAAIALSLCGNAAAGEGTKWDAAASLGAHPAPRGLVAVTAVGVQDPKTALDRLASAGFRVAVAVPPSLYYVLRDGAPAALPPGFAVSGGAETPGPSEDSLSPAASISDVFGVQADALPPLTLRPERAGARRAAATKADAIAGLPWGARWYDTSEFMMGRVAVAIMFPESDGSLDPNKYDWTPALRDSVVRSAVRGLAKWTVFAARRGIDLTFAIETHAGLATRYEPIDRPVSEEENWIQDALTSYLGYRSDTRTMCYEVANGARARLGAQWAAIVFAVNNGDPDSTFPDGYIAHSPLGGPYFVAPINNLKTSATLDYYMEHEMAHIFWALDENAFSPNAWWSCTLATGYLNQYNFNSAIPSYQYCSALRGYLNPRQCVIYGNYPDSVCHYTEAQVGWADRDANGALDMLETHPIVVPDSSIYRAVAGEPITLKGYALERPLANENPYHYGEGDSISIARIDSVAAQIDVVGRVRPPAIDGAYDSGREYFAVTLDPLPPGEYVVQWNAWNSSGKSLRSTLLTGIILSAPSAPTGILDEASHPKTSLAAGPVPARGPVRFALTAAPGTAAVVRIHDVQGRVVASWILDLPASGRIDWRWDGRVGGGAPAPSGLYFATVETDGARVTRRVVISR